MSEETQYAYVGDIVKAERDEAGNLMVFGKATGSDMDLDEQYADPEWLKDAMPDWAKWGNLREMHQPIVAGIGREVTNDDSGNWFLKSEVVDAGTAKKIEAGALKGYSIGIKNARVVKDAKAPGGRIVGGTIVEVSYVDRPCNPTSTIGIAKMVGAELAPVESETPGTSWLAKKAVKQPKPKNDDNVVATASDMAKEHDNAPDCPLCAGSGKFQSKTGKKHDGTPKGTKSADADLLARIEDLEKRFQKSGKNIDSGGRDVSDLDSNDFAGPDGTFPIKTKDDVHDAASLAHHAADPAAVRRKIKSIARRKFQMSNEEMPPSLKGKSKKAKTNKAAAPDSMKGVKDLIKSAVAESTADLRARAEAAEAKLEELGKTVKPGGPRPMGFPQTPADEAKAELQARILKYKRLSEETQDHSLSQGYSDLAKKVESDLSKLA
jgi:hypothetical protein